MKAFILRSYHRVGYDGTAVDIEAIILADREKEDKRKAKEAGFDTEEPMFALEEVDRIIS